MANVAATGRLWTLSGTVLFISTLTSPESASTVATGRWTMTNKISNTNLLIFKQLKFSGLLRIIITRAKDVLLSTGRMQATKIVPPAATEWSRLLTHDRVHSALFVPGDLDLWQWHSNSSKRGIKHIFLVNFALICSAVLDIFDSQTKKNKKWQTALKTEPYLCVVIMIKYKSLSWKVIFMSQYYHAVPLKQHDFMAFKFRILQKQQKDK